MFLDKLESGVLLFKTADGFARVEPASFWQRAYLLWTFRNFRRLSIVLLNPRQRRLVERLYRLGPVRRSREPDFTLVLGTVDAFVPAQVSADPFPDTSETTPFPESVPDSQ